MTKFLAAMLAVMALALAARATVMEPMSLDDLTASSQTVVYGKVLAARAEWDEGHRMIYTIYTVGASEYLKGQLEATFELREPGGEVDGMEMMIESVPAFRPGQEALLFVWTDPRGRHQVSAFEQGAVSIETDAAGNRRASRAIPLGSARESAATASSAAASQLLPQLFGQVRASIARTGAQTSAPVGKE